jgi:hypothetical protein
MALVTRYDTPAGLRDVPEGSSFYDAWHGYVNGAVSAFSGSPWIDPVLVDADVVTVRTLSWIGFPRATLTVDRRDDRAQGFADAEQAEEAGPPKQWRPKQFEYFEWYTTRDATGKVTKVAFSTETPQYFVELAKVDKERVVALYQEHVDPAVQWTELVDADGTYDPFNRWTTIDGIMHYVNGINLLHLAIGLAQRGAKLTFVGGPGLAPARDNFEFPIQETNAADDYIPREVAGLGRSGFDITVREPVGLYIDGWDDTGWTKPDGSPVGDYWRITRGRPGAVLRLEYEVPYEEGFVVGDILIGGRPVLHGGQLAESMTSSLPVIVARRSS